jgi:NYN domain
MVCTSKTRPATRAAQTARTPFPARALHLVDIENLAGTGVPAEWEVELIRQAYLSRVGIAEMDQIIIGCNHDALRGAGFGWPRARYLVRSGPDGADTELLAVIMGENVAARFTHVVIGSGDGAFTRAAAALGSAGRKVTVVSRRAALARTLKLAVRNVIYLDAPVSETAALRLDAA